MARELRSHWPGVGDSQDILLPDTGTLSLRYVLIGMKHQLNPTHLRRKWSKHAGQMQARCRPDALGGLKKSLRLI